ncbi:MAG TPA: XdhC family protein [Tepidisphaeraceae bacterium]|nr:XdhC family protein [Tepidisphaeraceae bacterium]
MKAIAREIVRRCSHGERVALCTVVGTKGSTPQARGAKMLVLAGGQTLGTLGGGCVEAEVRSQAIKLLSTGTSKALRFSLDHDYGWDDGLICGGNMEIFIDVLRDRDVDRFAEIADALEQERSATFEFRYAIDEREQRYTEDLGPPPVLVIAGAGHVGQALAALAAELEYRVDVIDDRVEYLTEARFPRARARIIGEIESALREYPINADTYVVIVTRGHRNDGRALAAVVSSPAKYVGLIGSKRKIKAIMDDLAAQGVDRSSLLRVHAPIGFDIGAVTVPEIALSIAAELVAVRRGCADRAVEPMKIQPAQLEQWLDRERR